MTEGVRPAPGCYRLSAGIVMFNRDGRVFVAQRIDMPEDAWQLPQGGIDEGECPRAAALRELHEEVGTAKAEIVAECDRWLEYDWPEPIARRMWQGRFRGQRQKWFAMRFTGEDSDIDIATANPEFRAWKWVEIDELPRLIVDFKRPIYEEIVAEFRHLSAPAS